MAKYYYVDLNGVIQNVSSFPMSPKQASQIEVNIDPESINMVWNFNNTWIWTKTGLIAEATMRNESETYNYNITWGSKVFKASCFCQIPWLELFLSASKENKSGARAVIYPDGSSEELTNAQIISLFNLISNNLQSTIDIYNSILNQINNGIVTNLATLNTQWSSARAGYANTRASSLDNEDLYNLIMTTQSYYLALTRTAGPPLSGSRGIVSVTNVTNGFQLSNSKLIAQAKYSVTMTISPTIVLPAARTIIAYVAPTNSITPADWVEYDRIGISLPSGIALTNTTSTQSLFLMDIPIGYFIRLLEISTGAGSSTLNNFREKY